MAVNGVNNNANTQAYRSQTPKKTDKPKLNYDETLDESGNVIKKGSYQDPDRVPGGLFTEEQTKFLEELKNDPVNQRLKDNQEMGKDAFMHILLTQLANQNPLNPMEDKDFIGQMAQFSALEGMQKMNENFTGLSDNFGTLKEGVEAIRKAVGEGASSKAVIKMNILLKHIAEKLGVDMAKVEEEIKAESEKAEGTENKEGTEGTEGTTETSQTEETNETQNTDSTESGEKVAEAGGTEANEEKATDKVNEETKKKNADKAYGEA